MTTNMFSVLIPAYSPDEKLLDVVEGLTHDQVESIVVINDGSASSCDAVFQKVSRIPKVTVLNHCTNMGKGAALKFGLNHLFFSAPNSLGVVTADADGQHLPKDIFSVGEALTEKQELILGFREFSKEIPLRSQFGNVLTKYIFRFLTGLKLFDTQTGLRGISKKMIPGLMNIKANRYEYELDMLLEAKRENIPIQQIPIETVYIDGNQSSHFSPIVDSAKIYFVLLRFGLSSMMTSIIDYIVFFLVFQSTGSVLTGQYSARAVAGVFNFTVNRSIVFKSKGNLLLAILKYATLVFVMAAISYGAILFLHEKLGWDVLPSKIMAEVTLFLATFAVQREFIFKRNK